jgi:hypothetical protein
MFRSSRPLVRGLAVALALTFTTAAFAQDGKLCFIAELDAAQVITGSGSPAKGTACLVMDPVANTLSYKFVYDGMVGTETMTHIHGFVPPGQGAPPQFTFTSSTGYKVGAWNYPEAFEDEIINELSYIKVHSNVFPSGEIRGQILRADGNHVFAADMDAAQVTTGSTSTAHGVLCAAVNTQTNTVSYQMTVMASLLQGTETSSGLFGYAAPGAAGTLRDSFSNGFHKKGSWVYPEADEASILADLAYAELRTNVNPNGEIRGQMELESTRLPSDKICFLADMDAAQVVTGSGSAARGTVCALMDPVFNTLEIRVVVDGLSGAENNTLLQGFAPAGGIGPQLFPLPSGLAKDATWVYPAAFETNLLNDLTYVQLYSTAFPGGEIRGQLKRVASNATLVAEMDAGQIITGSSSTALGLFCCSIDTETNTMSYQMTMTASLLQGAETLSHIHGYALPGLGAPPQHTMAGGFHKSGTWVYPEVNEAEILGGLAYAKVHTAINPTGEIRGQMLLESECDPEFTTYCTAGTSASGCQASIAASGVPSPTLASGFTISASGVEGNKDGLFFYGFSGGQANSWGNGTSLQCVVPPVKRTGLQTAVGTNGSCNGAFAQDLNDYWTTTAGPSKIPTPGQQINVQLWHRDPFNTSNQTTSFSNALHFLVCP